METQALNTQHATPTPWWKGIMITFGLFCLILWVASWLLSGDGKPIVYEPRPPSLSKAERREKKREEMRRKTAEDVRLSFAAEQFWKNYEERKLTGASQETSAGEPTTSKGKHPAIYHDPPAQ